MCEHTTQTQAGAVCDCTQDVFKSFPQGVENSLCKSTTTNSYATGLALASLFAYNGGMYIDAMVDCFYSVMTALVPLIVPIIVIYLVFRLVKGLLK